MILKRLLRNAETGEIGGTANATATPAKGPDLTATFEDDIGVDSTSEVADPKPVEKKAPEQKAPELKLEEKKVEQPKPQDKVVEKKVEDAKPNMLGKLKEKQVARDYTGFSEDQVKILKSMSNEACLCCSVAES